ncbi:MAG: hypothetical protein J7501_02400 [Bdellovibrio sp.]|nr:hypothetical protein [Bdellovibrio sp.]
MKARVLSILLVLGSSAFAGNSDIGSSGSSSEIQSVGRGELGYTQMEYCEIRKYLKGSPVDPFTLTDEESQDLVRITSSEITFKGKALEEPAIVYIGNDGYFEKYEQFYRASQRVSNARATIESFDNGPGSSEGYGLINEKAFSIEGTKLVYTAHRKKIEVADLRGGQTKRDDFFHEDTYCKVINNAHNLFKLKIVKGQLRFFHRQPGCTTNALLCTDFEVKRDPNKIKVVLK